MFTVNNINLVDLLNKLIQRYKVQYKHLFFV